MRFGNRFGNDTHEPYASVQREIPELQELFLRFTPVEIPDLSIFVLEFPHASTTSFSDGSVFPFRKLDLPKSVDALAAEGDFEVAGYSIDAKPEGSRAPNKVRVAVVQNKIHAPTTDPVPEQRNAILNRIEQLTHAAAQCGTNIICYQEAFREFSRAPRLAGHR